MNIKRCVRRGLYTVMGDRWDIEGVTGGMCQISGMRSLY